MHMQVRAVKTAAFTMQEGDSGPTTEGQPGSLIELLELLRTNDFNLKTAGGKGIEFGGEFVFALDDDEDHDAPERAVQVINDSGVGWEARAVEPTHCHVRDEPGGLLSCLQTIAGAGQLVDEIFVGTPEDDGTIPVQITTLGLAG
jgi:hypothetical protein